MSRHIYEFTVDCPMCGNPIAVEAEVTPARQNALVHAGATEPDVECNYPIGHMGCGEFAARAEDSIRAAVDEKALELYAWDIAPDVCLRCNERDALPGDQWCAECTEADANADPTPYCYGGHRGAKDCDCGPIARNH